MAVPQLDLAAHHHNLAERLNQTFAEVLGSGQFILGPYVAGFESVLAGYCGVRHAIGMSSGTDALLAALMAMDIGPGDEVITSPFTFFATAGSIARTGARPVFVDIDPKTYNIEHQLIEQAITEKTRAIIPVHLYGLPANMEPILAIAKSHGLSVIEDAAQAIGARYDDRRVGSLGDIGCLSFYPSKNLPGTGDGGACLTDDDDLAMRLRMIRVHGMGEDARYPIVGGNFRLDALQAAILNVKMAYLDQWTEQRRACAHYYDSQLEALPLGTPFEASRRHHVYNQYTVRVRGGGREALRRHLDACGIGNRVYYSVPLHLQPCFASSGWKAGDCPVAEQAANEVVSLPMFPELTREQQDEVIGTIQEYFEAE